MTTSRKSTDRRVAFIAALLLCTLACKTREVGNTPSRDGDLIFVDDFERDELGDAWDRGTGEAGTGHWVIKDGMLHAQDLRNDPLWYVEALPRKVRVEFEAQALSPTGDIKVEMFGDGDKHASGYVFIFGGWKNSLDVIARLDEHGTDRQERPSRKAEPHRVYRMAIERLGDDTVKWFVDDELFMTYRDSEPLTGPEHSFFSFNNWSAPVAFDSFKVYRLR